MGEMADYYNDEIDDMDELHQRYRTGDLSHEEAEAAGFIDENGFEDENYGKPPPGRRR